MHLQELALEWLESQRLVMNDPATADYFLQYTDGQGHKNGTIYNEPIFCGNQFFWDFTNPEAANYFITSVAESINSPFVDGTFTDDVTGVPAEHPKVQANINMTDAELAQLQYATGEASSSLIYELVSQSKYNWQAFGGGDGSGSSVSASSCATFMAASCDPVMQGRTLMLGMDNSPANANQTVAAFLIARPPYAYLGFGWESDDRNWNDLFYLQVGTPTTLCAEGPAGVFSRVYTEGTATLDCNSWTAMLPFPSLI